MGDDRPCWIVTGGSSGMGEAVARRACAAGADVIVWDIKAPTVDGVTWERVDLTRSEDVIKAATTLKVPLTAFVHCAGAILPTNLSDRKLASKFDMTMRLHTISFVVACQRLMDRLVEAKGAVVAITSVAAEDMTSGHWLAYGPSKAALWRCVREISVELAPRGVRVNAIAPGAIMTPMSAAALHVPAYADKWLGIIPMGRVGEADEIASVVEFLVSPMSSYVTGQMIRVDGGIMSGGLAGLISS